MGHTLRLRLRALRVEKENKTTLTMIMIVFHLLQPIVNLPCQWKGPSFFIVGQEADDRKDAELAIRRSHNETWIDQLLMKLLGLIFRSVTSQGHQFKMAHSCIQCHKKEVTFRSLILRRGKRLLKVTYFAPHP